MKRDRPINQSIKLLLDINIFEFLFRIFCRIQQLLHLNIKTIIIHNKDTSIQIENSIPLLLLPQYFRFIDFSENSDSIFDQVAICNDINSDGGLCLRIINQEVGEEGVGQHILIKIVARIL